MEAAQGLVDLAVQAKEMKDEENREKAAADADKMATATAVYSKMADFIDFCSQSDDPSLQPPPATSKTLPRISKAVRPTRLPYGPLIKPAEPAPPSSYSVDMDSGWLSGFV